MHCTYSYAVLLLCCVQYWHTVFIQTALVSARSHVQNRPFPFCCLHLSFYFYFNTITLPPSSAAGVVGVLPDRLQRAGVQDSVPAQPDPERRGTGERAHPTINHVLSPYMYMYCLVCLHDVNYKLFCRYLFLLQYAYIC